jgi:hypothetical protein
MVAIPLEMLLDSGRHVLAQLAVMALHVLGNVVQMLAHVARYLTSAIPSIYDVYVAIPLRLERMVRSGSDYDLDRDEATGERKISEPEVA